MTDSTITILFIFYMSCIVILGGRTILQEIAWSRQADEELQKKLTKYTQRRDEE